MMIPQEKEQTAEGNPIKKKDRHMRYQVGGSGDNACGGSQKEGESSTANTATAHVSRSAEEDELQRGE